MMPLSAQGRLDDGALGVPGERDPKSAGNQHGELGGHRTPRHGPEGASNRTTRPNSPTCSTMTQSRYGPELRCECS